MTNTEKEGLKPGYLPSFRKMVTFPEFLKLVKQYPELIQSSFERMERLITREGRDEQREARLALLGYPKNIKAYNAFSKRFKGIDPAIHRFCSDFIAAGAAGAEPSKQIFVGIGGKGSGKSQFFNKVKSILRQSEPVPYCKSSTVHDNPAALFYMIPTLAEREFDKEKSDEVDNYETRIVELRAELLRSIGVDQLIDFDNARVVSICEKNGVDATLDGIAALDVEDMVSAIVYGFGCTEGTRSAVGHPDPFVQVMLLGEYEFKGRAVPLKDYMIGWFRFTADFEGSTGIVDVSEVEPNNFEIGTWIGWEDLSKTGRFESGDPRQVVLNGALPKGNRGLVFFTEGFKNPKEARRVELEATQGKRIPLPAPLVGSLFLDTILAINSNEDEYKRWVSDPANEPYMDRYLLTWFKYPLEMDAAREILLAIWGETAFANKNSPKATHLDPLVAELGARLEILTRIEPADGIDPNAKVDAYNGVSVRQKSQTKLSLQALRDSASPREGLTGNSPRELAKQISALAAEAQNDGKCVTARAFLQRLVTMARETLDEENFKKYRQLINTTLDESYRRTASRMWLASTIAGFSDKCQEVFDKYLDCITAYCTQQAVVSAGGMTRVPAGGDSKFMRGIETDPNWGVTDSDAPKFRAEILLAVNNWNMANRGQKAVPYTCHEQVRRCIERFVVTELKSSARNLTGSTVRTDSDKGRLAGIVQRLIEDHGYCKHCANELLREIEEKESFLIES